MLAEILVIPGYFGSLEGRMGSSPQNALLEKLVERYRKPLLGFFARRVHDHAEAEEMTQEVFFRLAKRPDVLSEPTIEGYIFETAANLVRDRVRRNRVRNPEGQVQLEDIVELPSDEPSVERALEGRRRLRVLLDALSELSPKCRSVFLLHRYSGMPQSEIAKRFGISVSAVEKHMTRALLHVKKAMQDDDHEQA
ncbi:sigma factor of ECF subfamily [alpha proteobacterium U9-1i]|nr:sigma factor of ECF subfamily [alpha proteobacterium U9-1i]